VAYRVGKSTEWKTPIPDKNGGYVIPGKDVTGDLTIVCG
jgi:hypothetical protein